MSLAHTANKNCNKSVQVAVIATHCWSSYCKWADDKWVYLKSTGKCKNTNCFSHEFADKSLFFF